MKIFSILALAAMMAFSFMAPVSAQDQCQTVDQFQTSLVAKGHIAKEDQIALTGEAFVAFRDKVTAILKTPANPNMDAVVFADPDMKGQGKSVALAIFQKGCFVAIGLLPTDVVKEALGSS